MDEGQIHRGRGLVDLIAGVTPTLVDWANDPTDAADITDGDLSSYCTTGDKVTGGAWQYAYFEWDLGAFHSVICTGVGNSVASAGTPAIYLSFWDGAAWVASTGANSSAISKAFAMTGMCCSKVRLGVSSTAAATISPNIREFHVWRL